MLCAALHIDMSCMAAYGSSVVTSLTIAVEGNVNFDMALQNKDIARRNILDGWLLRKPDSFNFSRNVLTV